MHVDDEDPLAVAMRELASSDQQVIERGAERLTKLGRDAVPMIIQLLHQTDGNVHLQVMNAMRLVPEVIESAAPELLNFLTTISPLNEVSRQAVIELLSQLGPQHISAILQYIHHSDPYVRQAICELTGKIAVRQGPDHFEVTAWLALIRCRSDAHPLVRVAASIALWRISNVIFQTIVGTKKSRFIPCIADSSNRNLALRMVARAYSQSSWNHTADLNRLLFLPDKTIGLIERRKMAATVVSAPNSRFTPLILTILRGALQDIEDPYRAEYLDAIRRAGKKAGRLAKTIVPLLTDPLLRQAAIDALASLQVVTNSEVIYRMLNLLASDVDDHRIAALQVIQQLKFPPQEFIDELRFMVDDLNEDIANLAKAIWEPFRTPLQQDRFSEQSVEQTKFTDRRDVAGETQTGFLGETTKLPDKPNAADNS